MIFIFILASFFAAFRDTVLGRDLHLHLAVLPRPLLGQHLLEDRECHACSTPHDKGKRGIPSTGVLHIEEGNYLDRVSHSTQYKASTEGHAETI